jgi:hypothetical protein
MNFCYYKGVILGYPQKEEIWKRWQRMEIHETPWNELQSPWSGLQSPWNAME